MLKLSPWAAGPLPVARVERPRPWFLALAGLLAPAYLRLGLKVRSVRIEGAEALLRAYEEAREDKSRFIVAFRHPGDADPHIVFWFLHYRLGREEKRRRRSLPGGRRWAGGLKDKGRFGGRFVSGAEIPLWGGPLVRWALRNAGTVPVRHGGLDRNTLDTLVRAIADESLPVVLAPEGQVTYHSGTVQGLDAGAARLGLWAAKRLAVSGNPIPVRLIPLAVRYRFPPAAHARLPAFLTRLEERCGLARTPGMEARARLARLWERLVGLAEEQYRRVYNQPSAPEGSSLRDRLLGILEGALSREEAFYGLTPSGGLKDRTMAARAAAMERVFHPADRWARMSPLERGMARRTAREAFFLDRHQQLVDLGEYLDPDYAGRDGAEAPPDRLIETAQNLWDLANRLEGGDIGYRSRAFLKDVVLAVGTAVPAKQEPGESRHEAARRILSELHAGFEALALD